MTLKTRRPVGQTFQRLQGLMHGTVGPLVLRTIGVVRSPARLAGLGERLALWASGCVNGRLVLVSIM